jgi:DNA-binding FrmR family transcriptional regulator
VDEPTGSLADNASAKKNAVNRIRTIKGHVQGVERMIEEDRYCIDILKQIASVESQLSKLAATISESHMKHCVREAVEEGQGDQKIEELMEVLKYLKKA